MKRILLSIFIYLFIANLIFAQNYQGKKVLFINSYHQGDAWSDGIEKSIRETLKGTGIILKTFQMDTKRNISEEFKKKKALEAKALINSFKPDVVIAADDNASKYLIQKFYKNANLPFVFCGVNWDASVYGFPYSNVTGMIEVSLTKQVINNMARYARGKRIAFLSSDTESERKNAANYKEILGIQFVEVAYAKTFAEWKQAFRRLQNTSDMIILQTNTGIKGWNDKEAEEFVMNNIKVMVGTVNAWMINYSMIGIIKLSQEQGSWSANAALQILRGVKPSAIPIVKNKEGKLYVNIKLANKIKVKLDRSLVTNAEVLIK